MTGLLSLEASALNLDQVVCRNLFQFYLPKLLLAFEPQLYSNYLKSRKIITI